MGIKFKQIDNLQNTFDNLSGSFQGQIQDNASGVSGIYNDNQVLSGWKYFDNNVDISGAQGLLVSNDNIYTQNNLIANGVKIGFPIATPRNSTSQPEGSLQVSGGQIYFEDQLNIRNNAGINILNGAISGNDGVFENNLTLGGNTVLTGIEPEFVDFTPTGGLSHQEGRLFYDVDNFTLTLYNDEPDIALQVGQEQYLRVRNNTAGTISNGSVVKINGSQGSHPTINLANAESEANSQVVGLATHDIESSSFGYVTTYGIVRGINTSTYSAGR